MPDHSIDFKILSNPTYFETHNPALVMEELLWSLSPCGRAKVTSLTQIFEIASGQPISVNPSVWYMYLQFKGRSLA